MSSDSHSLVAICVSRDSAAHAAGVLDTGLEGVPAPGRALRDLGGWAEQFAVEAEFTAAQGTAMAVADRLRAAAGDRADTAVLPAANRRKRLLICDMDSTIIGQECLDELADFAGLKAEVSAITERAMRGELDFEAALTQRVAMLEGLDLARLEQCYDERITLTPGATVLVSTLRALGAQTILVSGGFTFFTGRVAAAAGFASHRGNTLVDDGKALTGAVGQPILGRQAKLAALNEASAAAGLAPADALAMGDGANDLAMIEAAGLGIAFRAKPVVAAAADAAIQACDLTAALFFQGIPASEFVAAPPVSRP